jgi:multicomponent Na+:H+ antiporter subunit C
MIFYIASMVLVAIGLYAVVTKENLIKKIIGLSIFTNGVHLFLMSLGYRSSGIAPIMTLTDSNIFSLVSVDPLPQALVLTSIVINISVTALALSIITKVYKAFGTVDTKKLKVSKG